MQTLTARRAIISCLTIICLIIVSVIGINRFGIHNRVFGQTGTIQAQTIVKKLVDNPKEAYQIWKDAGYRGRTIVFIADRWESFDPGELIPAQMFRAYPLQLYNTAKLVEDEYLNGVTFLYAATLNNIGRRIVAVMPEAEVKRMAEAARKAKDHRVSEKEVFLSRQGFPRWYYTGNNFHGVNEPVLLYIGASYFKNVEPEELFRQLSASGLTTDCIILCNETGKDTVTSNEVTKLSRFAKLIGLSSSSSVSDNMKLLNPEHKVPAS